MWIASSLNQVLTPTAIALGNFDGLHLGHQRVIQTVQTISGGHTTVVTFNPHPHRFFTGIQRPLLTPLDEKVKKLEALEVEQLLLLPFDQALARLSAIAFVEHVLLDQLQASHIAVGANFRFGHQRQGTAELLQDVARKAGVETTVVTLEHSHHERISSSAIRQALDSGDIAKVTRCLDAPYPLLGSVVRGQQLGRTIGFPTANLQVPRDKYLPRLGAYRVRVFSPTCDRVADEGQLGVMNIGRRPTITDTAQTTVEIHLLHWSGDLYGQQLQVEIDQFLRPEQKFASLEELKAQIQQDCAIAQTPTPV